MSGGVLEGQDIYMNNVAGVALSVDDDSKVNIKKIEIDNSNTAFVSRASSEITLNDLSISSRKSICCFQ
jgi:hypothetical protein